MSEVAETASEGGARVVRYAEVPYVDELTVRPAGAPDEVLARAREAAEAGVRRKQMTEGELGLYAHIVELPAGYEVPLHSHDHDEMLVILEGTCTMADASAPLGPSDMALLRAGVPYGFTAGPGGLRFLNIRQGMASIEIAS